MDSLLPVATREFCFLRAALGMVCSQCHFYKIVERSECNEFGLMRVWEIWPALLFHSDSVHKPELMPRVTYYPREQFLNCFPTFYWVFQFHGFVHIGIKNTLNSEIVPVQREPGMSVPGNFVKMMASQLWLDLILDCPKARREWIVCQLNLGL